jgi:membrane-associated phospholipid phosphatase
MARTSHSPELLAATVCISLVGVGFTVRRGPILFAWTAYVFAFLTFVVARRVADETFVPIQHAYVIHLEKALFLGLEPTVWLQRHFHNPDRTSPLEAAMVGVYLSYFLAPHVVAFLIWRFRRSLLPGYLALVASTYIAGLLVYFVLPTEPPWLASEDGHVGTVAPVIREAMADANGQAYDQGHETAGGNEVAAMPSLHMAITTAIVFLAWRVRRLLGVIASVYAAAMGFTLVYAGEHYTVDLLAGIALATAVWLIVRRLFDLNSPMALS